MGVQPAGRRRFRTRSLAVAVAALVSFSLAIVGLQPASASSAGAQSDLRVGRAGSAVAAPPRPLNITGEVQKIVLKFAAEKLAGFALNKLGLDRLLGGNGREFEEL